MRGLIIRGGGRWRKGKESTQGRKEKTNAKAQRSKELFISLRHHNAFFLFLKPVCDNDDFSRITGSGSFGRDFFVVTGLYRLFESFILN